MPVKRPFSASPTARGPPLRTAPDRSGVRMDCNRGNLRAVVGSLSEPTAAAGRGPPVEVVAAACAPSRPRSRAFGPFTVVRRRRPTASGPLGVRVGRSAALRGPSEPAGVPQGTPGNQNSARQRRSQHHTRTAGPARFAHACPEPRGTCPHASATENSPLTNGEESHQHRSVDEFLICRHCRQQRRVTSGG